MFLQQILEVMNMHVSTIYLDGSSWNIIHTIINLKTKASAD